MPHFSYAASIDKAALLQGDLLERTAALNELLGAVHPHFSRHDNLYFFVLTQSCDLVPGRVKTDYIAICPVRTHDSLLAKALPAHVKTRIGEIPVGIERERSKYTQFLERLFNNNEPGLFFLDKTDSVLGQDCCALTKLSISLKKEHYAKCLEAKVGQLSEPFQAKLGWLVGNTFSRVGTQDYPPGELRNKVAAALMGSTVWVPSERERKHLIEASKDAEAGVDFDVAAAFSGIPTPKQRALAVVERLAANAGLDNEGQSKLRKLLKNDPELAQIFK